MHHDRHHETVSSPSPGLKTVDASAQLANVQLVHIAEVRVGMRHRKYSGDLRPLARSIERNGLLHPIVITPAGALVAGERRLRACADYLGWTMIPANVIDIPSVLEGEMDENVLAKAFTVSERVDIGIALEQQLGERRGGDRGNQNTNGKRQDSDTCQGRTDNIAARRAGFGNRQTYRDAKKIVTNGIPALVEAMDRGQLRVAAALLLSGLPREEQERLFQAGKDAIKEKLSQLRRGSSTPTKPRRQSAPRGRRSGATQPDDPKFVQPIQALRIACELIDRSALPAVAQCRDTAERSEVRTCVQRAIELLQLVVAACQDVSGTDRTKKNAMLPWVPQANGEVSTSTNPQDKEPS